jgi:molecular chaperone DnaK (HSP70)
VSFLPAKTPLVRFSDPLHRRLIGRRFDDETVKKDIQSWPFKVIAAGDSPMVQVEYLGETKQFSPQEISAMVLVKVRSAHKLGVALANSAQ